MIVNHIFIALTLTVVVKHHLNRVLRLLVLRKAEVLLTVRLDAVGKDSVLSFLRISKTIVGSDKNSFDAVQV